MSVTSTPNQTLKYSALKKTDSETEADYDWQYNYRSAFTYAAANDLDRMGYVAPKRYATPRGPRYAGYTYTDEEENRFEEHTASLQISALEKIIVGLSYLLVFLTLPISLIFSVKFVGTFERLVVLRLGKAQKLRGPGTTVVLPCIDSYTRVDLRISAFHVPPMQIITIDRGLVELGATVFLQIKDAIAAVCTVQERNHSTRTLAITILYRLVCKKRICDLVNGYGKLELAEILKGELCEATSLWGIDITKVELSEIKVIKEGENIALSTFTKVLKSDFGNQLLKSLGTAVQNFVVETKKDLIEFPSDEANEKPENVYKANCESGRGTLSNDGNTDKTTNERLDLDQLLGLVSLVIDDHLVGMVGHIFQIHCVELGDFYIDLKNGQGSCGRGKKANADVTFRLNQQAFDNFLKQKLSPFQAYLDGSIQISGSKKAVAKLSLLSERLMHLL